LSWCKVMRKAGLNGIWIDDLAYDFARLAIAGRIEKNYRTSPAYLFSEFRRELVNANHFRYRGHFSPDFLCRLPGNTGIAAKRVSVRDH